MAMAYAHYADKLTGKDKKALLHELDATMSRHMEKSPKFYFGRWINYHDATIGGAKTTMWQNSFLSLAVQYGLTAYVSKQLAENKRHLQGKEGRPLLDYAVNPVPIERNYSVSAKTVELLLRHGADTKTKYNDHTTWENALVWQYTFYKTMNDGKAMVTLSKTMERLQILQHLIEHGADRKTVCQLGDGTSLRVTEFIELTYRDWAPDKAIGMLKSLNLMIPLDTKVKGKVVTSFFKKFARK